MGLPGDRKGDWSDEEVMKKIEVQSNIKEEKPWEMKIIRGTNGFILQYWTELDNGTYRPEFIAVEDPPDGNEAVTAQKLLYEVLEHFGIYKGIEISLTEEE